MNNFDNVIKGDYCIGCGVCAVFDEDSYDIKLNTKRGKYEAQAKLSRAGSIKDFDDICPFSGKSKDEDELSNIFLHQIKKQSNYIGKYISNYAGYAKDDKQRITSSSGGILSWLLIKLLKSGEIDGVVHVGDYDDKNVLMGYRISFSTEEIEKNKKSRYYPVEMSDVLLDLKNKFPNKRFAIVGIPCFIKAVRLLQLKDNHYSKIIKYTFGIVCGHLKTKFFAESYALEKGINPYKIDKIDFRFYQKTDRSASNYSINIKGNALKNDEKTEIIANNDTFYASDWGKGMFKYNACEFCDDILSETADITFGDAWLPEYRNEPKGTNLVIVRNQKLLDYIKNHNGELFIEEISPEKVIQSQSSGIKHRTKGLAYRLYKKKIRFSWYPKKRYSPSSKGIDKLQKKIFNLRYIIAKRSNEVFPAYETKYSFDGFKKSLYPLVSSYEKCYTPPKCKQPGKIKILYWKITDKIFKK